MAKIIRLTESQLLRLVKKIVKEQELDRELPIHKKGIMGHQNHWYDETDFPVDPDEFEHDEELIFGPDDYEDYLSHTETDFPENKWPFKKISSSGKQYYDAYTKDAPIKLRKRNIK